jgi:hypothetical protein
MNEAINLTGYKWWEHKNPSYRESCRRQAIRDGVQFKSEYDFFIKQTVKKNK